MMTQSDLSRARRHGARGRRPLSGAKPGGRRATRSGPPPTRWAGWLRGGQPPAVLQLTDRSRARGFDTGVSLRGADRPFDQCGPVYWRFNWNNEVMRTVLHSTYSVSNAWPEEMELQRPHARRAVHDSQRQRGCHVGANETHVDRRDNSSIVHSANVSNCNDTTGWTHGRDNAGRHELPFDRAD